MRSIRGDVNPIRASPASAVLWHRLQLLLARTHSHVGPVQQVAIWRLLNCGFRKTVLCAQVSVSARVRLLAALRRILNALHVPRVFSSCTAQWILARRVVALLGRPPATVMETAR
jgi:hypothetical protein